MLSRRKLLSWLSALPFVGVAFSVAADPAELSEEEDAAFVQKWLHFPVYAFAGETVTCENGHPICDFAVTVYRGQIQNVKTQLANWRQEEPALGAYPIPGCSICGAAFTNGTLYHIGEYWRDQETPRKLYLEAQNV